MRVQLLGVRGSTPAPGPEFVRYGGHTSCVAVGPDDGPPTLVLDAGTGARRLSKRLGGAPFRGTVLLSHLHWDHTHGLPFARALDHPDAEVDLRLPAQTPDRPAIDVLAGAMGPPHFPITPDGLRGSWNFTTIEPGSFLAGGFTVRAEEIPHKGGRTYGFRVSDGSNSMAYLSDHGPGALGPGPDGLGERHHGALALADGVDLLLHDAQHTAAEYPAVAAYGHSSIDYAVDLGRCAGAAEVLLFHHDPNRTDDELDAIAAAWSTSVEPGVTVAREGDDRVLDRDR
ncbi:MAG: MBL fold metallo-hydrolase [Acidimicrobiales bacterium]